MYTVVIAERKVLKLFETYRFLLAQLFDPDTIVFCEWNKKAESIQSMTQSLLKLVGKRNDWRAVVLHTDAQDTINPFDLVRYSDHVSYKQQYNESYLHTLREARFAAYAKAMENPLMLLGYALCGSSVSDKNLLPADTVQRLRERSLSYGALMLTAQFAQMDTALQARNLETYHWSELVGLVGEETAARVVALVAENNPCGIAELLELFEISRLILMLRNGATVFSDPLFLEQLVENTYKYQLLHSIDHAFTLQCEKPREVLCVSLRTADVDGYVQSRKWMQHDELTYAKFSEYNLYPDLMKFLLMDIHKPDHKAYDYDMVQYLSFLLLLAKHEVPMGMLEKNKVYQVEIQDDPEKFMQLLSRYDNKLRKTTAVLKEKQQDVLAKKRVALDAEKLIQQVDTPVVIPLEVELPTMEPVQALQYKGLVLAEEDPAYEQAFIENQYPDVRRNLLSFLKQPRHTLAQASEKMRASGTIEDERALYLNPIQTEQIRDLLYAAEDRMVTTRTTALYNNARYQKVLDRAEQEIENHRKIRMTRKTAFIAGWVALGAFFAGFLPLLFAANNTLDSWLFAVVLAFFATALFSLVGFWSLWQMRRDLKRLLVKFNHTVQRITYEVRASMHAFSQYLTHMCSFLRAQSVLNARNEREKQEVVAAKIYQKHIQDMESIRSEIRDTFGSIVYAPDADDDTERYAFDFSVPVDYSYPIPFVEQNDAAYSMDYLQEGNRIAAPVYYIRSILLRREELYD